MSHLWMVVTLFGKVAMTVGPLPYGEGECEIRKLDKLKEVHAILDVQTVTTTEGVVVKKEDFRIRCKRSDQRPELDSGDTP